MSILIFIFILFVLILVHEFGHFIVAKRFGIRVDEFGFGFPPRAAKLFKKGETLYTLNWIPFGGFVKIFGESPDEESLNGPDKDSAVVNKPKYVQALVLVAGVLFNIIFAWLLITVGYMTGLPTSVSQAPKGAVVSNEMLLVTEVLADSPAEAAGLKSEDVIVSVGAGTLVLAEPTPDTFIAFVKAHQDEKLDVSYTRNNEVQTVSVTPESGVVESGKGIGIGLDEVGIIKLSFFRAIAVGLTTTVSLFVGTLVGFITLIGGAIAGHGGLGAVTGPVGIVKIVGDAYHFGIAYLLSFTALISVNLAVINLIPFPALDGGRLLFIAIEAIKGSRINPKVANTINFIGFALLICLMILVTVHDVIKLF